MSMASLTPREFPINVGNARLKACNIHCKFCVKDTSQYSKYSSHSNILILREDHKSIIEKLINFNKK